MTDTELNRRLAEALGYKTQRLYIDRPMVLTDTQGKEVESFSPANDANHLREWVLPEIAKRKLKDEFCKAMNEEYDVLCFDDYEAMWEAFTAKTRDMAEAALKALEGKP